MGSKQRKPRTPLGGFALGRFLLGRRLDRNPLRRASDRVETVVLVILATTFLAAAPFAAQAVGAWAKGTTHQVQIAQEASLRQVPAVVLKVTLAPLGVGGYAAFQSEAQARWTAPSGKVLTGQVLVTPGTAVGATVRVWVNHDGQVTNPPLQDSQVTGQGAFDAALSVVALGVFFIGVGALTHRALDKRRMAAWDAEWQATGPRWTTRA
jgi:hypothetical protein